MTIKKSHKRCVCSRGTWTWTWMWMWMWTWTWTWTSRQWPWFVHSWTPHSNIYRMRSNEIIGGEFRPFLFVVPALGHLFGQRQSAGSFFYFIDFDVLWKPSGSANQGYHAADWKLFLFWRHEPSLALFDFILEKSMEWKSISWPGCGETGRGDGWTYTTNTDNDNDWNWSRINAGRFNSWPEGRLKVAKSVSDLIDSIAPVSPICSNLFWRLQWHSSFS